MNRLLAPFLALVGLAVSACAPLQQGALRYSGKPQTGFSENWFTSFDGARLGLSTWKAVSPWAACPPPTPSATDPDVIVVTSCDLQLDPEFRETVIVAV